MGWTRMTIAGPPSAPPAPPLRITVDGVGLAACVDALLAVPTPVTAVEVRVVRSVGQGGSYVWLGFVTYHPSRGWERNGLAAEAPGMGAGRRIVVDLRDLAVAVRSHVAASPSRAGVLVWHDDQLEIGGRAVRACGEVVPPVPDVPTVRDAVYLSGPGLGDIVVESEQGRISIPRSLASHLHQRGAHVAELGVVDGDVFVVAQSERRGEASTDPVIVAPVPVLMWSDASAHAEFEERRRQGGGEVEQLLAALDPATPVAVLLELLDTGVAYVRRRVAAHPALPVAVTDALARTGTRPMRIAVAANPSLGPIAVDALSHDSDAAVRAALAANPVLTPAVLVRLAHDREVDVRAAAATHPGLTPEVRAALATDAAVCVRSAVARDAAVDPEILRRLVADADPGVGRTAAANPACPEDLLERLVDVMPHAVLANPATPGNLLADGARSVDGALRAIVAGNPSTPGRVLTALSRDPDARVLRAVTTNPRAPAPARRRAEKRVATDGETVAAPASLSL